jgi:hypothetical protein
MSPGLSNAKHQFIIHIQLKNHFRTSEKREEGWEKRINEKKPPSSQLWAFPLQLLYMQLVSHTKHVFQLRDTVRNNKLFGVGEGRGGGNERWEVREMRDWEEV